MKKYKLGEICTIVPGYAFKAADFGKGLNYVIKIKDIMPPYIDILHSEKVETIIDKKYEIKYGDFVMAMTGATIGKIGKLQIDSESKVYINQRVCKFIPEAFCDKEYLYYKLNTQEFQRFIYNNVDSKLAQPNIGHPTIYKYELELPLLSEQRRIGQFLKAIDDKINLNRAINHNLEAMAKQLYDYWFVQFDFPNENGRPYKSSGGKMVWNDSLAREIPEGWNISELNKWLEIKSGFAFKSDKYVSQGTYKVITIKNVQEHHLDTINCDFVNEIPQGLKDWCILSVTDRLISLTGNCGRLCIVTEENLLLNQRVGLLSCREEYLDYVYLLLSSKEYQILSNNLATGAAQANLSPVELCKSMAIVPPKEVLYDFNQYIRPIIENFIQNEIQITTLTKQRNELLPLLMNGQVKVGVERSRLNYDLPHG